MSFVLIAGETLGALDRLSDIGDDALAPAPNLIAKNAEPAKAATPHRALDGDPSDCTHRVRDRPRVLDHKAALGNCYQES
jgi:hypothetical protein